MMNHSTPVEKHYSIIILCTICKGLNEKGENYNKWIRMDRWPNKCDQQPSMITEVQRGGEKQLQLKLHGIKILREYFISKYSTGVNQWHGLPMENCHLTILLSAFCLYQNICMCSILV